MANYTNMSGPEITDACGSDAYKWADAFRQHALRVADPMEPGFLLAWFANAMMAMHDKIRPDLAPQRLPDGSGFCVADLGRPEFDGSVHDDGRRS